MGNIDALSRPPAVEPGANMEQPYLVVDDFLPADLARAMRQDIEDHFAAPERHKPEQHQVWNYWFVPGLYTYLRTMPEKIIGRERVDQFFAALRRWSFETVGLDHVTWPYLSLYVSGCHQGLHNDSANGRIAFVYSLTKEERQTIGGQTLVFHEGDPFRRHLQKATAGPGFYASIEPVFNRLVLFDDRMPHAVQRLDGSMDPLEGRFVLHGHISEANGTVEGALPEAVVMGGIITEIDSYFSEVPGGMESFQGPLTLRVTINREGAVTSVRVLLDRVAQMEGGVGGFSALRRGVVERLRGARFPPAEGDTSLTLPILFGGVLSILTPSDLSDSP